MKNIYLKVWTIFWKNSIGRVLRHKKVQKYGIFGVTMPLITVPKLINLHKILFARNFRVSSCHIQKITNDQEVLYFIPSNQVEPGRDTLISTYSSKHIIKDLWFLCMFDILNSGTWDKWHNCHISWHVTPNKCYVILNSYNWDLLRKISRIWDERVARSNCHSSQDVTFSNWFSLQSYWSGHFIKK